MGARPDVIVVGAGIVGCACARALAREGLEVLVVDASFPGGGTTAAGMGHIVVMDDSPAELALSAYSRGLWAELADELPRSVEDRRPGTLWLAAGADEMPILGQKRDLYQRAGVHAEVLDATALRDAEPNLRLGLAGGLVVPDDRVLYPPNAARWMLDEARRCGAVAWRDTRVVGVAERRVMLARAGGVQALDTGAVVIAAGIDAPTLIPELPIVPRKGHLAITDRAPGMCRHQLVELGYLHSAHALTGESTAFNLQPRATGQVLIGSSRQLVGRDASITPRVVGEMLRRAVEFMPPLASLSVLRIWTGFRPATPDSLPLIGPWPEIPGVWIAAGHEGLGITTATGTAELIVAGITGTTPPIDAAPFAPSRTMAAPLTA
ncbi:MAG TPA: FAD-dependent oxidoreductase [Gemmatimonadaceae bacterium]|nr:FAD-dependent oxidoreductase [Gemmatimonadaceae bacterium]